MEHSSEHRQYTCPMHPEVVKDVPGKCPICGMNLVPLKKTEANEVPALAQANVGIAMGTGTDAAIQSAGITLVKGDLVGIIRARKLVLP